MNVIVRGTFLCLLALTAQVHAGALFKCVNAKGIDAYQQAPCPVNSKKASVRYVASVPDDQRLSWSGQAGERQGSSQGDSQASYSIDNTSRQSSGTSNYERDEAKRRQDIEASEHPVQNRRLPKDPSRARQPLNRVPTTTQIQDYNGNTYTQPPGSVFATDNQTGQQCFVNGQFIEDCH